MNDNKLLKAILCAVLVNGVSIKNVMANPDPSYLNLSEKLVQLRGEVSDLNSDLRQLRDEHKLEMRGLITQRNTLNASVRREDLAIIKLKDDLLKNKALIKNIGADTETIKEALLLEIERLKSYVVSGIPFKVADRLNSIEEYEQSLRSGVLSSHRAVNTLWSLVEDELKLARSNGVFRQPIAIDDKEYLAHVAKLGMVLMYFRVNDGVGDDMYGVFKRSSDGWLAVPTESATEVRQIKNLFDSLEKQVRIGYFELPNAL